MAKGLVLNIDTTKSEFQNPMVELRQGDGNYQSLTVTVTSNGEPLDLTGWTTTFMGTTAGNHKIVDANVQVDNTQQGVFTYTPTKAWGQDIGEFSKAYFKFSKDDQAASGANFRVKVFEAVDLTEEEAGNYISVVDVMVDKIKTDMDNKLKDTQVTLNATQDQAKTVQSNVDALNTNVNTLKAQNNNIITSNNSWTGTNTFNKLYGKFESRILPDGTDLYTLIESGLLYSVPTATKSSTIINKPSEVTTAFGVLSIDTAGYTKDSWSGTNLLLFEYSTGKMFTSSLASNGSGVISVLKQWTKIATDESLLVHKTGTETVGGDKTFTGNTSFSGGLKGGQVNLPASGDLNMLTDTGKYYQTTYLNVSNWTNRPSNAPNLAFSVDVIGQANRSLTTQVYYVHTTSRMWVRTMWLDGTTIATSQWVELANDSKVVHNTGDESIGGNKSITGSLTINDANPLKVKQSATIEFDSWQSSKMKATRFGNIVSLRYSVNPNNNNTITKNQTSAVVIPQGYRPIEQWNMAVGGVSAGSNVLVNPDGSLTSGWQDVQYAGMMTAMYFTNDPFPS